MKMILKSIPVATILVTLSGCSVEDASGPDVINGELPESKYELFKKGIDESNNGGSQEQFVADGQFPTQWLNDANNSTSYNWIVSDERASEGQYSIKSGNIPNSQYSVIYTEGFFSAGNFSFDYFISSESNADYFRVFIDGSEQTRDSGIADDWRSFSVNLAEGYHLIELAYQKDSSVVEGEDGVWVDNLVIPELTDDNGGNGGETSGLDVIIADAIVPSTADTGWETTTSTVDSTQTVIKASQISDNQVAAIEYTKNFNTGGTFVVEYKVSSESNYDWFRVTLDGSIVLERSGDSGLTVGEFNVSSGTHTIQFSYSKDGSQSAGDDTVWIESVTIPD